MSYAELQRLPLAVDQRAVPAALSGAGMTAKIVKGSLDHSFTQAQADGYLRVVAHGDNVLLERWSQWCGRHRLPIVQVWERPDRAWVALDLVFIERRLSAAELDRLRQAWERLEPRSNALYGVSPLFCHFAGLDSSRANALARELLDILADGDRRIADSSCS
jgi:hypothetical protein